MVTHFAFELVISILVILTICLCFLNSWSPKSVMLFGMITQIFCGNMTGLVNSYELHVFFRCLSAICCCQMYTAGSMICKLDSVLPSHTALLKYTFCFTVSDITSGKPKTIITTLFESFWSVGVIFLPVLARLVQSWTHLYMAISWPTIILIILWRYVKFTNEKQKTEQKT